jgi:hypothetical protein
VNEKFKKGGMFFDRYSFSVHCQSGIAADKGFDEAKAQGWKVVNMKNDRKQNYPAVSR